MGILGRRSRRSPREAEFIVIGLGRFGGRLARQLAALDRTVLGIDTDAAKVQDIADEITDAAVMDATSEDALREIGVSNFDTAVVTMLDNFEASTLCTISLKRLGVPRVIGVAHSERHREVLLRIGADRVVQPIQESGDRLAYDLAATGIIETIALGSTMQIIELSVPVNLEGRPLGEFNHRQLAVLAVLRGGRLIPGPPPEMLLIAGDLLVIAGESSLVESLARDAN